MSVRQRKCGAKAQCARSSTGRMAANRLRSQTPGWAVLGESLRRRRGPCGLAAAAADVGPRCPLRPGRTRCTVGVRKKGVTSASEEPRSCIQANQKKTKGTTAANKPNRCCCRRFQWREAAGCAHCGGRWAGGGGGMLDMVLRLHLDALWFMKAAPVRTGEFAVDLIGAGIVASVCDVQV